MLGVAGNSINVLHRDRKIGSFSDLARYTNYTN